MKQVQGAHDMDRTRPLLFEGKAYRELRKEREPLMGNRKQSDMCGLAPGEQNRVGSPLGDTAG